MEDVAEDDLLDELGLDAGFFDCFLEEGDEQALELGVFEETLLGLCQGGSDRECDDLGGKKSVVSQDVAEMRSHTTSLGFLAKSDAFARDAWSAPPESWADRL